MLLEPGTRMEPVIGPWTTGNRTPLGFTTCVEDKPSYLPNRTMIELRNRTVSRLPLTDTP